MEDRPDVTRRSLWQYQRERRGNGSLTEEHLGKMVEDHLLKEDELGDRLKVARIVQKLVDTALELPDRPWHDWDEWVKGLE